MPDSNSYRPPVYAKLKSLHLTTDLVKGGRAAAAIVTPAGGACDGLASRIRGTVEKRTGVRIPILKDGDPGAAVPLRGNLIVLGNRSTNRTVEALYNRYFTLLDLRYPGSGGHEVRSLHNPFGGGHNVIFVGGSDAEGVSRATDVFVEKLTQAEGGIGSLSVGRLMEIGLGRGVDLPEDLGAFQLWEASEAYGSKGNFGWNSLSKRMAMYYTTGDPFHAREFVRLAFPDERAREEIYRHDDERIENKDEPLSGPYHYGAYTLILYWDLIEESPVFTDEERLRITNAFSKQFAHPQEWGWRREIVEKRAAGAAPAGREWSAGDRHGVWQFVALYCLARYFQKDYDDPLWPACIEAVEAYFDPLHRPADLRTAYEHLYWYVTGITPAIICVLLSGDQRPVENGALAALLRGQEILISGRKPDWSLRSAPIGFLHQAAYLTQDGRWLEYVRRTDMDLSPFRLGQSFWPEARLKPVQPADLVGRWTVQPMPGPMWRERASGLPFDESFLVGSFRSSADASGDFILIKGWNGAGRNPFHTFGLLELRLAGRTVLEGYFNQVMTRSDGLVPPEVGMDAALRRRDVIGGTAVAVGETPKAAFCSWRRTLLQRVGQYALIADDLAFRTGGENVGVDVVWQRKTSRADRGLVREREETPRQPTGGWLAGEEKGVVRVDEAGTPVEVRLSDPYETVVDGGRARMTWIGRVEAGERRLLFSLIGGDGKGSKSCARLAGNAAALGLPEPAVVVAGEYEGISGELVALAVGHLFGLGVTQVATGSPLLCADAPVCMDWDFEKGVLHIVTTKETRVNVALEKAEGESQTPPQSPPSKGEGRGQPVPPSPLGKGVRGLGLRTFVLPAGPHCIEGARPDEEALERVAGRLGDLLEKGRRGRRQALNANRPVSVPKSASLHPVFSLNVGGEVMDLTIIHTSEGARVCVAEGSAVHGLTGEGKEALSLRTDGPIRVSTGRGTV